MVIFANVSAKPFYFKQFAVADDQCTHKVGTDAVLLGSWTQVRPTDKRMLDIGTGSGLIALMLAQRSEPDTAIDAIEPGQGDAAQARENILRSPWAQKISVAQVTLQAFHPPTRYDLIVSNPPYFTNSLLPPDEKRRQARHTETLTFDDLLEGVDRLLSDTGRFAVVLPYAEGVMFKEDALTQGLFPARICRFRSRKEKPVERLLLEFTRRQGNPVEEALTLYARGDAWSEAYKRLTGAFYLKV